MIVHVHSFYWIQYKRTKFKKNNNILLFVSCLREKKKSFCSATASVEQLHAFPSGAGGEKNFLEAVASPAGWATAGSCKKNY